MISDRFVEDGTFLRLNYLQISYNMPQKMVKKNRFERFAFLFEW